MDFVINCSAFIYVFFVVFAAFYGYKEEIPSYMLVMQSAIAFMFFICVKLSLKIERIRQLLGYVFLYTLILSFLLRYLFVEHTGIPFADATDSYFYDELATKYIGKNYLIFFRYGLSYINIDDFGFLHIIYIVYHVIGDANAAQSVMLILNSLCITYTSYIIYKLCLMLDIEKRKALFAVGLYGFFPFLFVTSAVGLKENFFCLFITLAFYFIYRYKERKRLRFLIGAFLFIVSTWFFRMAIFLMIFVSFCLQVVVNDKNKKMILFLVVIGSLLIPIVFNTFLVATTGISLEQLLSVTEARGGAIEGDSSMKWGVQLLSGFLGPFPNFTRAVQYGIYHSSGLLLKCLMGLFFFYGLSIMWRRMDFRLYPLVLYLLMGYAMLVLGGVALDMRYHITFFPLWVVFLAYTWQNTVPKIMTISFYMIFLVCLITFYNLR